MTPAAGPSLLPCPFCGDEMATVVCGEIYHKNGDRDCPIIGRDAYISADKVVAWNTRPHASSSSVVQGDASGVEREECSDLYRFDDPFNGSVTRLAAWPEGLVLWHDGEIVWRSWGPKALRPQPSGETRGSE